MFLQRYPINRRAAIPTAIFDTMFDDLFKGVSYVRQQSSAEHIEETSEQIIAKFFIPTADPASFTAEATTFLLISGLHSDGTSWSRSLDLTGVDVSSIKISFEDSVLTVVLPKEKSEEASVSIPISGLSELSDASSDQDSPEDSITE